MSKRNAEARLILYTTAVLPVIRYAPVCPKYARAYTEADVTWYQPLCVSNYKRTT